MGFPARFTSKCADCSGMIHEGDTITMVEGSAVHVLCTNYGQSSDPLHADHPVCPDCFLTHPAGVCDR